MIVSNRVFGPENIQLSYLGALKVPVNIIKQNPRRKPGMGIKMNINET